MSDKRNIYFAAKDGKDLANNLLGKSDSFYNYLSNNAYLAKIADSWRFYYGMFQNDLDGAHKINFAGEQGELVNLPVNHYRNIGRHIIQMITANRPALEARAINTDARSLAQAYLANGVLDYYLRERGLEDALKAAVEMAVVLGSGFIKMEWNATAGEPYDFDEETQQFSYQGEIEFSTLSPFDVVFDGTKESFKQDWILTRTFKNRYDLMAKYPELATEIEAIPTKSANNQYRLQVWSNDETDDIPVYEFFHKRSESLPNGRYLLFLSSNVVLMDLGLPYRTLPIFRMSPGNIMGTPYGYSDMFDLYPLQEAINALHSTIMSNQNAFGVQSLFVPRNSDISIASLEGGMNIISGNEPPVPIQLTSTPKEVFDFAQMMVQSMETISGINSVTRGNPEASLKSGTALALVQSMSIQYISSLQQSYVRLVEDLGTQLINNLKDFARAPRVAAIVGKNNRTLLKEFTGDDLEAINRVVVDIANPLSRTTAGRVQMAEQLLQMGSIKNPAEYFQVLNTGKLDVMFEGEMHEMILIKQENEAMMSGQESLVSPLDEHKMHILEHRTVLSDVELRKNPELVSIVMDHIQKHMDALRNVDPALLGLIGEQPLGPVGGTPPAPSAPNMPPASSVQPGAEQVLQAQPVIPPLGDAGMPNIPTPPAPFDTLPVQATDVLPKG